MTFRSPAARILILIIFVCSLANQSFAQSVKRIVIIKIDGLPGYYFDRFVKQSDPETGRSVLPWFDEVFYKNGTRIPNFYTRGMSLSGPSWGALDTGQHLQIKGNVEYDRYTLHSYDYLNFVPYYIAYGLNKRADMPAVEVMDQLRIPLFCDAFPFERRYTSQQLYQRGYDWAVLASGFVKMYPGDPSDFIDEWTLGLNMRKVTIDQVERDVLGKIIKNPEIDYFDYYDGSFDHVSHHNSDVPSRLADLKALDRLIGRVWTAIKESSRADETALVIVSDHGINSQDKIYSQGFNLVKLLASSAGGGNHVVTKRRLMLDYSIKGIYPLIPLITTTSHYSNYLKGQSSKYPTALVDFDGNERSSIHLRNSDLNIIHVLLQQLQSDGLSSELKVAATSALFRIIEKHRANWQSTNDQLSDEIGALHRSIESQKPKITSQMALLNKSKPTREVAESYRRDFALFEIAKDAETDYKKYIKVLTNLIGLNPGKFDARKIKIEDVIAPGSMGDSNSIYQLENYVVGVSPDGLTLGANKELDLDKSFARVNYFELLHDQRVRSNVQPDVGNRPVDFVAVRVPVDAVSGSLPPDSNINEDPIWLYGGPNRQALLLSRPDNGGGQSYRYLPISNLSENEDGKITFQVMEWEDGFPLKYYEDRDFAVPPPERSAWFSKWHTEAEWMLAVNKSTYSNAIIGLNEQVDRHPVFDTDEKDISPDDMLIRRLRQRQRQLTEADMLVLANNHWNFDVRGFNPGGNHGSFFRSSTNSTFMIAGGANTGIPRGLQVETPYDSLSLAPTLFRLMGKIDGQNRPNKELRDRGFKKFPGRVVKEIIGNAAEPILPN